jgi:hypothetical protein
VHRISMVLMVKLLQEFKYHLMEIAHQLEDSGLFQNCGKLGMTQQAFLKAVLEGTIPNLQLHTVLLKLTKMLHVLYQRRVIILIDEYDTPTSYAVQHEYFPEVCPSLG